MSFLLSPTSVLCLLFSLHTEAVLIGGEAQQPEQQHGEDAPVTSAKAGQQRHSNLWDVDNTDKVKGHLEPETPKHVEGNAREHKLDSQPSPNEASTEDKDSKGDAAVSTNDLLAVSQWSDNIAAADIQRVSSNDEHKVEGQDAKVAQTAVADAGVSATSQEKKTTKSARIASLAGTAHALLDKIEKLPKVTKAFFPEVLTKKLQEEGASEKTACLLIENADMSDAIAMLMRAKLSGANEECKADMKAASIDKVSMAGATISLTMGK
jgi:hypothetical protein